MVRRKRGDTRPLVVTLEANRQPVDLTGATVEFHMRPKQAGIGTVVSGAGELVDAPAGVVRYVWDPADVATAGIHRAEFEVTFGDGTVETFPSGDWIDIEFLADLD